LLKRIISFFTSKLLKQKSIIYVLLYIYVYSLYKRKQTNQCLVTKKNNLKLICYFSIFRSTKLNFFLKNLVIYGVYDLQKKRFFFYFYLNYCGGVRLFLEQVKKRNKVKKIVWKKNIWLILNILLQKELLFKFRKKAMSCLPYFLNFLQTFANKEIAFFWLNIDIWLD